MYEYRTSQVSLSLSYVAKFLLFIFFPENLNTYTNKNSPHDVSNRDTTTRLRQRTCNEFIIAQRPKSLTDYSPLVSLISSDSGRLRIMEQLCYIGLTL